MNASALVLAGGDGKRFGGNKLSQCIGEKTLLERVLYSLTAAGFPEILVVVEKEGKISSEVRVIVEEAHSIYAAIRTGIARATFSRVFLTAGDMPFLKPEAILWQLSIAPYTIPVWKNGYAEPMHSVVGKNLIKFLEGNGKLGKAILASGAKPVPAEKFPEHEFFNVNTREELEMARRIAAEKKLFP